MQHGLDFEKEQDVVGEAYTQPADGSNLMPPGHVNDESDDILRKATVVLVEWAESIPHVEWSSSEQEFCVFCVCFVMAREKEGKRGKKRKRGSFQN